MNNLLKEIKISIIILIVTLVTVGCGKTNQTGVSRFLGEHSFSGPCKYSYDGFGPGSPPWEFDSTESLITAFYPSPSKDSSNYIIIPIEFQENTRTVSMILAAKKTVNTFDVAALISDSVITIPLQMPASGSSMSIEGEGSLTNNRITISYLTSYRGLHKYSSLSSQ